MASIEAGVKASVRPYYPRASKILDSIRTNGSPVARSSGVRGRRPSGYVSRRRPPSRFPFSSRPTIASKASNAPRNRVSANGRSSLVSSSRSRLSASFFRIETDTRIQPESRRFAYRLSFASYLIYPDAANSILNVFFPRATLCRPRSFPLSVLGSRATTTRVAARHLSNSTRARRSRFERPRRSRTRGRSTLLSRHH